MHLSTAIILMFVAGALVWAAVAGSVKHTIWSERISRDIMMGPETNIFEPRATVYGWPLGAVAKVYETPARIVVLRVSILIDLAVAIAILLSVWLVCEKWIQRRRS